MKRVSRLAPPGAVAALAATLAIPAAMAHATTGLTQARMDRHKAPVTEGLSGAWNADVSQSRQLFRGRYQPHLGEARDLLGS